MIQSTNEKISDILKNIDEGKIQLPDFQRGWVWDDYRIRSLIASISNGYPIGAAMFLQTGGKDIQFKTRLFEGVDEDRKNVQPARLVLDGQQRNTSIYRAMYSKKPVKTTDGKKHDIIRFYYINIPDALNTLTDRIDAIVSVPENKLVTENIGRDIKLDLSTREKEFGNHHFPANLIFDSNAMMQWQMDYMAYHQLDPNILKMWREFFSKILQPMTGYQIPVITLGNDVPKEAVCQVFENVNQGGVSLTVFELVTATFATSNCELRKEWETIWKSLKGKKVLCYKNITAFSGTDFLTALTLLANYYAKKDVDEGKGISCKKKDVLKLKYEDYVQYKDQLIQGLNEAVKFLQQQCVYTANDLPYTSQLIPLSVLFAIDSNMWFSQHNLNKLEQWYWCGVFGELYGSANEGRYVNDVMGMLEWTKDDNKLPDTVIRSNFHASRLQHLYTRNSAAYKGVMALILKAGAEDFLKGQKMNFATFAEELTDIHHIFPANYCEKTGIERTRWNSVVNKTPIYARTNRIIGGYAPSQYLSSLERNHKVDTENLNKSLKSHQIDVASIRSDNFEEYYDKRYNSLLDLIEKATGKEVSGRDIKEVEMTLFDIEESEIIET